VRRVLFAILFGVNLFVLKAQTGLYFTPNLGQWDEPIVAKCLFKGGAFFIRRDGFRIKMFDPKDLPNIHKAFHMRDVDTQFVIHGHVVDVGFRDCNLPDRIEVKFEDETSWYENYYLGADAANWVSEVYPVKRVRLKNVYPGIDFVAYTKGEEIEFDWIVQPGGDPGRIYLNFTGQNSMQSLFGEMTANTSVGPFTIKKPIAIQNEKQLNCEFIRSENPNLFRFNTDNFQWDKSKPLVIDPVLVFSTYSGSAGDNFGFTATYDTAGHLYAGGIVDNSQGNYPVTTGSFQTIYGGKGPAAAPVNLGCDVAISKYKPDGSSLVYATYLGGKSNEYPHSLGIDEKNNLLILGTTLSSDFPLTRQTCFDSGYNGKHDLYVVKLSADGKKMLAGTYLGGSADDGINTGTLHYNYADDFRGDIICDDLGNIYFTTCTKSPGFPVTPKAMQTTLKAGLEGVVVSLNSDLSKLRWSTFVGGNADDAGYGIKQDASGHIFVSGGTSSSNFPIVGKALHPNYLGGRSDAFIIKMTSDSGKFTTSTFWGTDKYEQAYFIDFDNYDKIYVTGQTEGLITRTAGTYGKNGTTQFIARLSNNLDSQEFATTFGNRTGTPELSPCAFMVDKCYNIYFSGWGSPILTTGTTQGLEITPNAIQKTTDDMDFYLIVLGKDAKSLLYATYFGGDASEDHVDGGTSRFDKRGIIYQSVCASCPDNPPGLNDFPTTSTSAFPANVSYRCSNASFKLDFKITYAVEARFTVNPTEICTPDTVFFYQTNTNGKSFQWDFGDGTKTNAINPFHIYTIPKTYTVKLRVIDSGSCNVVDSMTKEIKVMTGPEIALEIKTEPCQPAVELKLSGKNYTNPTWDLGDKTTASGDVVKHIYNQGNYKIKVVAVNPISGCKDSITKNISINKDSFTEVFLANVFTPNKDGKNDCYKVYGLSKDCDEAEIKIFNRWGELLFQTKDLSECWNGTVANTGATLPEGTYFYQLFLKSIGTGKKRVISGSINLLR